jgi:predicted esterase
MRPPRPPWQRLAFAIALAAACSGNRAPPSGGQTGGSGVAQGSVGAGTTGSGGGGGGEGGAGGGNLGPKPNTKDLPAKHGLCPMFIGGTVTFGVDGIGTRDAELRVSDIKNGPLWIVWHGQTQSPSSAIASLAGDVATILAKGGMVVAPYHDPSAGVGTWFASLGDLNALDDFQVLDQIVVCALERGIDTRHIHMIGFQEGAVQAAQSAVLRSGWVASAVIHSGALPGTLKEQITNLAYPFMIVHGGTNDATTLNWNVESKKLGDLAAQGAPPFSTEHFTVMCDHGGGAMVAPGVISATLQFMHDTPFGTVDTPYGAVLPAPYPKYCAIHP